MSSTVTTTTVSTVTTVAFAGSLSLITLVVLLILLINKEVISTSDSPRLQSLNRGLNTAIVPLTITFFLTAVVKLAELLG